MTVDLEAALRVQLGELNERARAYTAQTWQVPFAYLGIVGVVLGQLGNKSAKPLTFITVLSSAAVFGIVVAIHMTAMCEGIRRAVNNIRDVEQRLGLDQTAEFRPLWHIVPLISVVAIAVVLCILGVFFFACSSNQ